jgi:hypothetical protein
MKHLKKYSELEEINEISKELGKRAADAAFKKMGEYDDEGDGLRSYKYMSQHDKFMKVALGKKIVDELEKLGYSLEIYYNCVELSKNGKFIARIKQNKTEWVDYDYITSLSENQQRRILYLVKQVEKNIFEPYDF